MRAYFQITLRTNFFVLHLMAACNVHLVKISDLGETNYSVFVGAGTCYTATTTFWGFWKNEILQRA